ncbi:MAG TPA: YidC/Oxa1 family membrane protein insertase [Candidatus Tumulicola sp.]
MHLLDPIVNAMSQIVWTINKPVHNLGWSLIILAALIRIVFLPLNTAQFKSMLKMQRIAPQIKKLQARFKDDKTKLQQETMALYKQQGVNPLAGCWPMLVQWPFIISVYYVVMNNKSHFENQDWVWIGSHLSTLYPTVLATSLAHSDIVLLVLYAGSMYFSVRFGSMPATDPQQAQTQRLMSFISPLMLGFFGWKYHWPSAMVLYWFSYNVFTMAQTLYMLRQSHEPLSFADSGHVFTDDLPPDEKPAKALPAANSNGAAKKNAPRSGSGRSKKKNKKGA